jgi:hypothetical protein
VNFDVVDFVAERAQTFIKLQHPMPHRSNSLNPKQMFSTYFHKVRGYALGAGAWGRLTSLDSMATSDERVERR